MIRTTTQAIAEAVGGNWQYNRRADWWEDDKGARALWVAMCSCDDNCNHPPQLWLYGRGIPQRLILGRTGKYKVEQSGFRITLED